MRLSSLAVAVLASCTAALAAEAPPPIDATSPSAPAVPAAPASPLPPATPVAPKLPPSEAGRLPKASEVIRFVPSGDEATVALSAVANPDCSSAGKTVSRILSPPQHGEVTFVYKKLFTTFASRIYEHCNEVEVPGMETHYKSAPDFFGEDTVDVLYIYPNGNAQTIHFVIEVK